MTRGAVAAAVAQLGDDVSAPDQPDRKDQQRRRQHVEVLDEGLQRVVDHRPLVGRCDRRYRIQA